MVERQTEDALDKATDNMFSRPSIDAGIKPTRRELKEVCVFISFFDLLFMYRNSLKKLQLEKIGSICLHLRQPCYLNGSVRLKLYN